MLKARSPFPPRAPVRGIQGGDFMKNEILMPSTQFVPSSVKRCRRFQKWLVLLAFLLLSACAHGKAAHLEPREAENVDERSMTDEAESEDFAQEETFSDPLESWNRLIFHFNDKLYFWVMKPLSKGYNAVVPQEGRVSIRNAFQNIRMPIRAVSSFLQGRIKAAGIELARFGINSTMGLAGLYDVANSEFNIKGQEQDLGLTLGYYGIAEGPYIIWPFLGPSCLRDTIGTAGDGFLNPVNYVGPPIELVLAVQSFEHINAASLRIGEYEALKESAIEPYIALRSAYLQYRRTQIRK